jgi:hypothetical protein
MANTQKKVIVMGASHGKPTATSDMRNDPLVERVDDSTKAG